MRKIKNFIGFAVFIASIILVSTKSFAAEVKYTENLIPKMTSATSPSGKVSADSYDGVEYHWHAFDRVLSTSNSNSNHTAWVSNVDNYGWLSYEFSEKKCITKYVITVAGYCAHGRAPKNWTFEGLSLETGKWVILDKHTNEPAWANGEKRAYTFNNETYFKRYRINITATQNSENRASINELEMMETIYPLDAPTNLSVIAGDSQAKLSWNAVEGATSYNIMRSTVSGEEEFIKSVSGVSGSAITFIDKGLTNGTTYYYVVKAVGKDGESRRSNEVAATPLYVAPEKVLKLVLEVKEEKQLSVSDDLEDNTELEWTSSDEAIATVDANGKVKALKPGNTTITCVNADGSYTDRINVLVVDLELQLSVDLHIGESCRLTVGDLANADKVTWVADDPTIATVSNKGKVTAVNEGLSYITALDEQGIEVGRIYIRVRQ